MVYVMPFSTFLFGRKIYYEIHDHNTQQSKLNFTLPKPNTNYMKKAFVYRGAEIWNSLPIDLKSLGSIMKSKIKQLET